MSLLGLFSKPKGEKMRRHAETGLPTSMPTSPELNFSPDQTPARHDIKSARVESATHGTPRSHSVRRRSSAPALPKMPREPDYTPRQNLHDLPPMSSIYTQAIKLALAHTSTVHEGPALRLQSAWKGSSLNLSSSTDSRGDEEESRRSNGAPNGHTSSARSMPLYLAVCCSTPREASTSAYQSGHLS